MQILPVFALAALVSAGQWDTYPKVPKTASINGFADPIYEKLPSCAKECVKVTTKITPCPYWDTGCFCVMPQWSGMVGSCFAEKCKGSDVASATSLAYSLCEKVGANIWMMPASVSTQLSEAAGTWQVAAATTKSSDFGDGAKLSSVVASAEKAEKTESKSSLAESLAAVPASLGSSGAAAATSGTSGAAGANSTGTGGSGSSNSSSSSSVGSGATYVQGTSVLAFILLAVVSAMS